MLGSNTSSPLEERTRRICHATADYQILVRKWSRYESDRDLANDVRAAKLAAKGDINKIILVITNIDVRTGMHEQCAIRLLTKD